MGPHDGCARLTRPQKITLGEMRESGLRGLLVNCSDYKCSHYIAIDHIAAVGKSIGLKSRTAGIPRWIG
jgi:hypothetical protein